MAIDILLVTMVCSSSKYNVRPKSVLKNCWSKFFHYTDLLVGDIFDVKSTFFPMKQDNHHNQTSFQATEQKSKCCEKRKKKRLSMGF